jgi:hypothetical protein
VLTLVLTSCLVGTFTVDDGSPAANGGSAGSADAAGSDFGENAGMGASSTDGGNPTQLGGNATTGGQIGKAGSAVGGSVTGFAGEPVGGQGGEAGATSTPMLGDGAVLPCALDDLGAAPLLCDDFNAIGSLNAAWQPNAAIVIESADGPHGNTTGRAHLNGEQLVAKTPLALGGSEISISFWFRVQTFQPLHPRLVGLATATDTPIRLTQYDDGLHLVSQQDIKAPSATFSAPGFAVLNWYCIDIQVTSTTTTVSYYDDHIVSFVVDGQPTTDVDETWLQQAANVRAIASFVAIGSEPAAGVELLVDDVRIARGKNNVCGL